jgi:hypothetical protein
VVLRALNSSDVAVDEVVQAKQHNTLRDDVVNALAGLDYASETEILAETPAVGDTAFAMDTGALYLCLVAGTWTLWVDPPGQAPSTNYWDGLKLTVAANSLVTLGRGSARNIQDTASINQDLDVQYAKKLDEEWAAGNWAGMRDPNYTLAAKRWFNLYLLGKSSDPSAFDLYASGVATDSTLTLPAGWTTYAFIGAVYWDGGGIREFIHRGREFRWKQPQLDVDANAVGTPGTFQTQALSIPITGKTNTLVRCIVSCTGGGVVLRTPGTTDAGTNETTVMANRNAYVELLTNSDGEIEYTMTGAWGTVSITTIGWDDERGFTMIVPAAQTLQFLGTAALTSAFTLVPGAVAPDDSYVYAIDDNGTSGGDVEAYAMTNGVPAGSNVNTAGNNDYLRGGSIAGMWLNPAGTKAAVFARHRTTQVWHLSILDISDPSNITSLGQRDISGDAMSSPPSTQVEAVWDDTRDVLYLPTAQTSGTGIPSIVMYDVSTGTPSIKGTHTLATASSRTCEALRWSETKECLYGVGAEVLVCLTPNGTGSSLSEAVVDTFADSGSTLCHDGVTLFVMSRSASPTTTMIIKQYDIDQGDETSLSVSDTANVALSGLITGTSIGAIIKYSTVRNNVLGAWCKNLGNSNPAQYLTFDVTDSSNVLFLEELIAGIDPDSSHICSSSQHELFDGLHTQIFIGNIPDDVPQTSTFSVVAYA